MKNLTEFVVDAVTNDEYATKTIAVFPGRFQPFHDGHYSIYEAAVKLFGKKNVFIVSSNVTEPHRSPFTFKEKRQIINKLFNIPTSNIVQVKHPYTPVELTKQFDGDKTAMIVMLCKKDAGRLYSGKYYKKYSNGSPMVGLNTNGYVLEHDMVCKINATKIRKAISSAPEEERINVISRFYKQKDKKTFELIKSKFTDSVSESDVLEFIETGKLPDLLRELTTSVSAGGRSSADDGPNYHFPSWDVYKRVTKDRAEAIGYQVIDYVLGNATEDVIDFPIYPDGPVDSVTFFPAGVAGKSTPMNQSDIVGTAAWNKWFDHVKRVSTAVGYELVKTRDERIRQAKDRKQSSDDSHRNETLNESQLQEEYSDIIDDCIGFTLEELGIEERPPIHLTDEREDISTTAYYNPGNHEIKVYTHKRALADVLRSIVHELVHHKQNLENRLQVGEDSKWAIDDTDPLETEAHAMAGHIITKFKKEAKQNIYVNEAINIDVKVGDTILTGKFKNKKTVVKSIGEDEHGMPTINGRKVVTFRFPKDKSVNEETVKLPKSLGIPRKRMPQIKSSDVRDFIVYLKDEDVDVTTKKVPVSRLKMTQREIDSDKVHKLMTVKVENLSKPVITSKGGYILDGHHRVVALYNLNPSHKISTVSVSTNIRHLLVLSHNYSNVSYKNVTDESKLVTEGGGAGHMAHPFDDMKLTFGDLKEMVKNVLQGKVETVTEKLDGQNLMVSYRDGSVVFARNKGHIKGRGTNGLSVDGVKQMFSGRGEIEHAFSLAAEDLESAILKISDKQRTKIFENGQNWMTFEVIYPATTNVIPYGHTMLVFHNVVSFTEEGKANGIVKDAASLLSKMIKQTNAHIQSTFDISGPLVTKIPPSKSFDKQQAKYLGKINKLKAQFKLKDSDEVGMYHQKWWENFVDSAHTLPERERMGLVKRWAFNDKTFRLRELTDETVKKWADKVDKKDQKAQAKKNIAPFEEIFLGLGADVLQNIDSLLVANPEKAVQKIRKDVTSAIKSLQGSTDINAVKFVTTQLDKLNAIGGLDAIAPVEGVVFSFKGNIYKLTGTFAPINQILGYFKYN